MTVALVFIDTIILAGKSDPKNMYSSPHGPESQKAADDQWAWIEQTLTDCSKPGSKVGWIFVAGHYPGMENGFNPYLVIFRYYACCSSDDMKHNL